MSLSFYSTTNPELRASLREAVLQGLAPDGGLFMPTTLSPLPQNFIQNIQSYSFGEIACQMGRTLFANSLDADTLEQIIEGAFTFDAPLVPLHGIPDTAILELFGGPTLSFKDFGARFMAHLMAHFMKNENRTLTILVATSGDTGSAVASGFYTVPNIRVCILYPSGKVSDIQEKQLTTYGGNITALEVDGTFDDCQKLVKQAFQNSELRGRMMLASANSINIARLFPQSFYYAYAYAQSLQYNTTNLPVVVSVPSGNFGNLTAGLIAKKIGIPLSRFIAATNINDVVPQYLSTGQFRPRQSSHTISNAMDVGNPSNFARILALYEKDRESIRQDVWGASFSDEETRTAMKQVYEKTNYILDPHGAVGCLGLQGYRTQVQRDVFGIFLETAHPAKFFDEVRDTLTINPDMPERLSSVLGKEKQSTTLSNVFEDLKEYLLAQK